MNTPDKIDRDRTAVFLLLIATTPLLVFPYTYDQFILPKTVWIKVLTELLALLTVLRLATGGDFRLRVHPLSLVFAGFVLWKAVSWLWADSRSLAADDMRWWAILLLLYFLFHDWLERDERRLMLCAWALTISAFLLALWILLQDFGVTFYKAWVAWFMHMPEGIRTPLRWIVESLTRPETTVSRLADWRGRLWAGLGNTNHIADCLALLFPMITMLYLTVRAKRAVALTLLALVVSAAALIACWSVSSNGGLILAGLVLAVLLLVHESGAFWRKRALRVALLGALFGAVTAFYVLPHRFNPHPGGIFQQAFSSKRWRDGWETRVAIWFTSMEMIRAHPVLGIGAGNFTYGYTKTLSPRVLENEDLRPYAGMFTNAAHNAPLQAWVETGAGGLLLLLLLWALFIRTTLRGLGDETDDRLRRLRVVLMVMMVAFIGHSLMNFTLQLPTSSLMFVGLLAVAATLGPHRDEFPLTVRSAYRGFELDLETTGMRWIESVGLQLTLGPRGRRAFIGATLVVGALAIGNSCRPLVADMFFNRAKHAKILADYLGRVLEQSPDPPPAVMAQRAEALRAAEPLARRALALNRNHHHARKLLGRVMLDTGRYRDARAALEEVDRRESVFDFYDQLGWACWHAGDREAAGRYWATYFSRRPQLRTEDPGLFAHFSREFPKLVADPSSQP